MTAIAGLDLALAAAGVAVIGHDDHDDFATVITSKGKRSDTVTDRRDRIRWMADRIADLPHVGLVVAEGPSHGSRGGSAWDRAGLWWRVIDRFERTPVAVVPPPTRAKWATGNGRADKAAVAAVAARLCPHVELGSADAADALILALMGQHALMGRGYRHDTKYRWESLVKCEWPLDIADRIRQPYEEYEREVVA